MLHQGTKHTRTGNIGPRNSTVPSPDEEGHHTWIHELIEMRIAEQLEREVLEQLERHFNAMERRCP